MTAVPTPVVAAAVALLGEGGPSLAFLETIGLFAVGGALARLFWDATAADYSFRRQVGFVGVSVVAAFGLAFVLWDKAKMYPSFLAGITTLAALVGPADMLTIVRDLFMRTLSRGAP